MHELYIIYRMRSEDELKDMWEEHDDGDHERRILRKKVIDDIGLFKKRFLLNIIKLENTIKKRSDW